MIGTFIAKLLKIHMVRVAHIAVNLALMVVLTMNPVFAHVVQQDCSADCSSGYTCQGCNCCKVQSASTSCPCSGGKSSREQDFGGCCRRGDSGSMSQPDAATSEKVDPLEHPATVEEANLGVNDEDYRFTHGAGHLGMEAAAKTLSSACTCVSNPDPPKAPITRSPHTELRDVLSLAIIVFGVHNSTEERPIISAVNASGPMVTTHFSQISLCVWRL